MTPLERWNGLAWVCMEWLWKGLARCDEGVFWNHSVPPNTTRSTRQVVSVWVCPDHFHFFPKDKPWKHGRERTNRRLAQATIQEVLHQPMFRATFVTCSRTHQGMDTDGLVTNGVENWVSPPKSHQRSQSTGCVFVRKAPTNPHSQASAPQAKDRWGLQGSPRWGFKRHPRQGVNVHMIRL